MRLKKLKVVIATVMVCFLMGGCGDKAVSSENTDNVTEQIQVSESAKQEKNEQIENSNADKETQSGSSVEKKNKNEKYMLLTKVVGNHDDAAAPDGYTWDQIIGNEELMFEYGVYGSSYPEYGIIVAEYPESNSIAITWSIYGTGVYASKELDGSSWIWIQSFDTSNGESTQRKAYIQYDGHTLRSSGEEDFAHYWEFTVTEEW